MKQRLLHWFVALLTLAVAPAAALAQRRRFEERDMSVDARLEGYEQSVTIDGGTGLTWFLLVILGIVCVSVLFKDARRTHLD